MFFQLGAYWAMKLVLEWHFCVHISWLGNSVRNCPACPDSPRLTIVFRYVHPNHIKGLVHLLGWLRVQLSIQIVFLLFFSWPSFCLSAFPLFVLCLSVCLSLSFCSVSLSSLCHSFNSVPFCLSVCLSFDYLFIFFVCLSVFVWLSVCVCLSSSLL